jgi:hypothetical protein
MMRVRKRVFCQIPASGTVIAVSDWEKTGRVRRQSQWPPKWTVLEVSDVAFPAVLSPSTPQGGTHPPNPTPGKRVLAPLNQLKQGA